MSITSGQSTPSARNSGSRVVRSATRFKPSREDFFASSSTCSSFTSLEVNFNTSSWKSDISIEDLDETILNENSSRGHSSNYFICDKSQEMPSALNNFLDWLAMCFWKCSPGCQQLPEKRC